MERTSTALPLSPALPPGAPRAARRPAVLAMLVAGLAILGVVALGFAVAPRSRLPAVVAHAGGGARTPVSARAAASTSASFRVAAGTSAPVPAARTPAQGPTAAPQLTGARQVAAPRSAASRAPAILSSRTTVRLAGGDPPVLARATRLATRPAARTPLTVTIVLRRRDQAGFERLLAAVTDPRSPLFRHFVDEAEQTARFGPSARSYGAIVRFLRERGLRLVAGSADRLTITARGPLAAVERAFAVGIGEYALDGHVFTANAQAPALPAHLAHSVAAIVGLSSLDHPLAPAPQIAAISTPSPPIAEGTLAGTCELAEKLEDATGTFSDALGALGGIEGGAEAFDIATTYYKDVINFRCAADELNLVASYVVSLGGPSTGASRATSLAARPAVISASGQKIGLLEFANYKPSDVSDFVTLDDLPPSEIGDLSEKDVAGGAGPAQGAGESEALLDIDATLTLAPGAHVVVYDTAFTGGASFQAMFNAMIGDGDTVISNSWSECEDQVSLADAQSIDEVLASAAAAGITVLNGSGDSGSTCLDGSPDTIGVPADSPHATAVGGSSITPGPLGSYGTEQWWNGADATPPTGQGGHGVSRYFPRPSYQDTYTTSSGRSIPDLVSNADPADGYTICEADAGGCPDGLQYGGTSAATPIVAALVADLNSELPHDVGELNPLIYPLGNSDAFHSPASLDSDFAHVGLGSPNFDALYLALTGTTPGPVDASTSSLAAAPLPSVAADGSTDDTLVALLLDANGNPIAGQHVTLTASGGSHAVIEDPTGVSTADNGIVVFHVHDATAENVTFTATDTDENVALAPVTVTFSPPPASGGEIEANPTAVTADGTSSAQIEVKLVNALGQPAVGKTVTLVPAVGTHATITGPTPLQTDATGVVTFAATDSTAETVSFTAVDVTDGDLPVPGSASVTFSNVPPGQSQCVVGTPQPAAGSALSPFASGFPYSLALIEVDFVTTAACSGEFGLAFSPSGSLYVSSFVTNSSQGSLGGSLYRFGASGGLADAATELPGSTTTLGPISGIAFGPGGVLFGVLPETNRDYTKGAVVELDPSTGAITKTILAGTTADPLDCPDWIAVDPLSGDLFVSNGCTGFVHSDAIIRIHDPLGTSPSVSDYVTDAGSGQIAFAPDGSLFQASYTSSSSHTGLLEIGGTNTTSPTVTEVGAPPSTGSIAGLAVGATNSSGHAQTIYALGQAGADEEIYAYSLGSGNASASAVATIPDGGGGVTAAVGPDGCLYFTGIATVERLTDADGACALTPNPGTAALTLAPAGVSPGPKQGSTQTLTATVAGAGSSPVADLPVEFTIAGANTQVRLADTNSSGVASITYQGVNAGIDDVTAQATVGATSVTSNQSTITWSSGPHATELDLASAPGGGPIDATTQLSAVLDDYTANPPSPIAGATVALSLGGQTCDATTDASGRAACAVSTALSAGIQTLTAAYTGSSQYAPSSASQAFILTPLLASTLTYSGAGAVGDGSSLAVAASLALANAGGPLGGRAVTFTLGGGAGAQTCSASTDASGTAACTIPGVSQAPGSVPLTVLFAGDASDAAATSETGIEVSPPGSSPANVTVTSVSTATSASTSTATQTVTSSTSSTTTSVAPTPLPPATVILACTGARVTLTDIVVKGSRVLLTGAAETRDAGDTVTLLFDGATKVASARVGTGGLFSASAPLPAARLRDSNTARYSAVVAGQRSAALKLTRRLILDPPASSGGRVQLTGRILPPLASPIAAVTVQQQTSCSATKTVARIVPGSDGDYSVSLPDPSGATAVYRLTTKVRDTTRSPRTFATFSLPELVQLG